MHNDMNYVLNNSIFKIKKVLNILLFLLLMGLLFTFLYRINLTSVYMASFENNDDYNLKLFLPVNDVPFIYNEELIIDNEVYNYKIVDIENISDEYYLLYLKVDFDNIELGKKVISVKSNVSDKRLIDVIWQKIKEGLI